MLTSRLLAHAGYDPQLAVDHFSGSLTRLEEIQIDKDKSLGWSLFKPWTKSAHPTAQQRVDAMTSELDKWREEAIKELEAEKGRVAGGAMKG